MIIFCTTVFFLVEVVVGFQYQLAAGLTYWYGPGLLNMNTIRMNIEKW